MSSVSVLAPLGIGLLAWAIAGCTISGNMQEKNSSKLVARFSGTVGGAVIGFLCLMVSVIYFDDSSTESSPSTVSSMSTSTESNASTTTESDISNVEPKPEKTLSINVTTLSARMQKNLVSLGSKFKVHFDTQQYEHSTLSKQELNDRNAILITSDNTTGKIINMVIITSGDGTMNSGFDAFHTALSAISATLGDNEMKSGKSSEIVMGLVGHKFQNDEVYVNQIKYSFLQTKDGLMTFFISAK